MNRRVSRAVVTCDDGTQMHFEGAGHLTVVNTVVPGKGGVPDRPVRYATITISLPAGEVKA